MTSRLTDPINEPPWAWLRLHRGRTADPRFILVRAICSCGWIISGDPPTVLGGAAEHFRQHFVVNHEAATMTLEEDADD